LLVDGCKDDTEDPDDDNDGVADLGADGVPDNFDGTGVQDDDKCAKGALNWTSQPTTNNDSDGCKDDTEDDNDGCYDQHDALPLYAEGGVTYQIWYLDSDGDGYGYFYNQKTFCTNALDHGEYVSNHLDECPHDPAKRTHPCANPTPLDPRTEVLLCGDSIMWGGDWRTESGVFTEYKVENGIATTQDLHLTIPYVEGFDCDGTINKQIGEYFQGGILFYKDPSGKNGLVIRNEVFYYNF